MTGTEACDANRLLRSAQSPHFATAVVGILLFTAAVRLVGVDRPLVGNFSTKSVIYAMIARNWAEGRAGLLYPTLDCLVGGQRSLHMLEFSVSAQLTGLLWKIFGGNLDVWGRATSVAFLTGGVLLMVLFVRPRHGPRAALAAGVALSLAPVSMIYGQTFMLDASIVFFSLGTFVSVDRWLTSGRGRWLVAGALCLALLLLTKVYLVVLLVPLGAMVLWPRRWGPFGDLSPQRASGAAGGRRAALVAAVAAVLPVLFWCLHAIRTASPGSPWAGHIYSSLQGNAAGYRPPDPLLLSADFYRHLLDDLTGPVLAPVGFTLALLGVFHPAWRRYLPWLAAMAMLIAVLPRKFHQMNYYYLAVLPPLCVMAGLGWEVVARRTRPGRMATAGFLAVCLALSIRYAYRPALFTPPEDRGVVAAGRAVRRLTAEEEPVATMHGSAIDLLYYCHRPGWALDPNTAGLADSLRECRAAGARYLVVAGRETALAPPGPLGRRQPVLSGEGWRVYALDGQQ